VISVRPPGRARVEFLVTELSSAPFSYPEVGSTRGAFPSGYNIDRYAAELGRGDVVFDAARQAIRAGVPFDLPWVRCFLPRAFEPGAVVVVVARVMGVWWTNASRVIYTIDERDRFGFAYGTLPRHAEVGEELFLVERARPSEDVTFRIEAFSRPRHPLVRLAAPFSRAVQRRFGRGALDAMRAATSS